MTGISAYGVGSLATLRADTTFRSLKAELEGLQTQLSTGRRAESHAGLGTDAPKSLSGRATLAAIEAHAGNVGDAQLRVRLVTTGLEQIQKIGRSLTTSLAGSYETTPVGQTSAIVSAADGMRQVLDILNTKLDDRALFAGRAANREPAAPFDLVVEGDGTRAGLRAILAERRAADLGADGLGRLATSDTANGIAVAEEAAGLPFGMKIGAASATGGALAASVAAGPPPAANLAVAAQPTAGDTLSLTLRLPDGSSTTLAFTAGADAAAGPDGFAIGPDAAATAANLRTAVRAALARTAAADLPAASALGASQAFFAGSPANPPLRVAGPPYETATATVAGTAADTVIWYGGDDAAGSARETAPVRVGDGAAVAIGARANEPGIQRILAALGALVGQDFPAGSAEAQRRYAATADAVAGAIGTGVEDIVADFATAGTALGNAAERLGLARTQVTDAIAGAENAEPNEVAMKLLAAQTRLQASYQTTSAIAKLSLVDFI